ncbi:condensin complex subunit 3 [Pelomyxa schiedti]|nr:condensin complex subunit 3 [Pelomyxa schiedti]
MSSNNNAVTPKKKHHRHSLVKVSKTAPTTSALHVITTQLDMIQRSPAAPDATVLDACGREMVKAFWADTEEFTRSLISVTDRILLVADQEITARKVILGIASFFKKVYSNTTPSLDSSTTASSIESQPHKKLDEITSTYLRHVVERSGVANKSVRLRTCQIVEAVLAHLGTDVDLPNDLWNLLEESMLPRTTDKIAAVREQAISAIKRLQDTSTNDNPVVQRFLNMIGVDPSCKVRCSVLHSIVISPITIPSIILRTRDTKEDVRKLAYEIIGSKIDIHLLTLKQRAFLVHEGLGDRSLAVQQACKEMVTGPWLVSSKSDPILLIQRLHFSENPEETEMVANCLALAHASPPPPPGVTGKGVKLSVEYILFLRSILKTATPEELQTAESVFPEILLLCGAITHITGNNNPNVKLAVQILLLIQEMITHSMCEEGGKTVVLNMTGHLFTISNLDQEIIEAAVPPFVLLHEDQSACDKVLVRTLNEMQNKAHKAALLHQMALLDPADRKLLPLIESVVLPCIQNADSKLRLLGVKCLSVLCLTSEPVARDHITLLSQIARHDTAEIRLIAIKALFDLAFAHGINHFVIHLSSNTAAVESSSTAAVGANQTEALCDVLREFVASDEPAVQDTAAEGFAKLMYNDLIDDATVLGVLVIIFFSPDTANSARLQQCLSVFFDTYTKEHPNKFLHRKMIEDCFFQVVMMLLAAKSGSGLSTVDAMSVVRFLLDLISPLSLPDDSPACEEVKTAHLSHNRMAISLINNIILCKDQEGPSINVFSKALGFLQLVSTDQDSIKHIRALVAVAQECIGNKQALQELSKFVSTVVTLDSTPEDHVPIDAFIQQVKKSPAIAKALLGSKSSNRTAPNNATRNTTRKAPAKRSSVSSSEESSQSSSGESASSSSSDSDSDSDSDSESGSSSSSSGSSSSEHDSDSNYSNSDGESQHRSTPKSKIPSTSQTSTASNKPTKSIATKKP